MNFNDAKKRILLHAGFQIERDANGIIGRLRPYKGLDEIDFAIYRNAW